MAKRPPIPIPFRQRWKEFRGRGLPPLIFAAALAGTAILWKATITPSNIVGEVEQVQSWVTSSQPGTLVELNVSLFDFVKAGTPVAVVKPSDPRAALDVIGSELAILRLGTDPTFQRLRLDLQNQKVALATARSNLQFADIELNRTELLFKQKMETEVVYYARRRNREALAKEVEERTLLVADFEKEIGRLRGGESVDPNDPTQDPLQKALAIHEERLREIEQNQALLTLTAPIDGTVTAISRRQGENVAENEPIVIISATQAKHIIGYVRQPVNLQPIVGMPVDVRTRSIRRESGRAQVVSVGAQLVPLPATLLMPGILVEMGLPIQVSVPPGLNVRPGETVDLTLPHKSL